MARDVNDVIVEIISEFKNVEKQSAIDFVKSKIYDSSMTHQS